MRTKSWTRYLKLAAIFYLLLLGATSIASAQEGRPRVGVQYGYTVPDADNTNPRQIWGITGMAAMSPSFSFGGYYHLSESDQGTGGRQFDLSTHGLLALYAIGSSGGETFFGMKVGLSKMRTQVSGVDLIFSPYHYGVMAGYDHYVFSRLVVGFEGSFLRFQQSDTSSGGVTYVEPKFNTITFMVSLKVTL